MTHPGGGRLGDVVATRHVIVCCGTGGVGKTTLSAALAVEGARRGRRVVVVTIDPAKRLADALGVSALGNEPVTIERARWDPHGRAPAGAELDALMLDTRSTFDGLVHRYAAGAEQADRILENTFYRNLAGALSGTQEYMAAERLHELHEEGGYDLIVVDTPPSRHALDFLDAPSRLARLLDNRVFQLLMAPTRASLRVATAAAHGLLRATGHVVGSEVVDDVIAFFRAFEGMEQGFRERAAAVQALLAERTTAFVLVSTPSRDAADEAAHFAARLAERAMTVDVLVVNRVHPRFDAGIGAGDARARARRLRSGPRSVEGEAPAARLADAYETLAGLQALSGRERARITALADQVGAAALMTVPALAHDVHDLAGLAEIDAHLFGPGSDPAG